MNEPTVRFTEFDSHLWDYEDTQTDLTIVGAAFMRPRSLGRRLRRWLASALSRLALWLGR